MANRFSVEAIFKAVDKISAPVSRMQSKLQRFSRGMNKAFQSVNRKINKITRSLARSAMSFVKYGSVAAGALGGAVIVAINKVADRADFLAKQSRRLQFPIQELQEFKFVAEQSGVSVELLDKSLGAFSKRLGEAKGGTGPLITGLKNINPALLDQLKNTESVSKAFELYINAIRQAETATEKAALANAAFSRAGLELVNISENSADAIKKMRIEQRQNGLITMKQAEAAEHYNDAVNSLKKSLTGLIQNVFLPMMPAITRTLRRFREWIVANREFLTIKITETFIKMKNGLIQFKDAVVNFVQKYNLAERIENGFSVFDKFSSFLSKNGMLILKITGVVIGLTTAFKILTGIITAVNVIMAANPMVLGIMAAVAAIGLMIVYWEDVKKIISSIGSLIVKVGKYLVDKFLAPFRAVIGAGKLIGNIGANISRGAANLLGFGGNNAPQAANQNVAPQIVSPEQRNMSMIQSIEKNQTEITIKDDTGRAEVTKGQRNQSNIKLQNTGSF